jgi:NAD(P)-dependent dehydrogenase (short-subunit alcohol dehydrogenase family)
MTNIPSGAVLVTGACGLLGSAVVRRLAALGCPVLAADIKHDALLELSSRCASSQLSVIEADLSSDSGIDRLMDAVNHSTTPIIGAVHTAYPRSPGWGSRLEDLQEQNLSADLSAQLGGSILFSRAILGHFQKNSGGSLVHISSIQGVAAPKFDHYTGTSMHSPIEYAAIKAGIISITRWLAKYYSNQNIRVNCVSPGGILDRQPDSFLRKYRSSCTNIGMLTPEHVVDAIAFLLSDGSSAINGQNLIVDDGWSL